MKLVGSNDDLGFYRKGVEENRIKISIRKNDRKSETLIGFADGASVGIDARFDAINISKNGLRIYSLLANQSYAIQGLPKDYLEWIPLGVEIEQAGEYQLVFRVIGEMDSWQLYDSNSSLSHALTDTVDIYSGVGIFDERFQLVSSQSMLSIEERPLLISIEDHLLTAENLPFLP